MAGAGAVRPTAVAPPAEGWRRAVGPGRGGGDDSHGSGGGCAAAVVREGARGGATGAEGSRRSPAPAAAGAGPDETLPRPWLGRPGGGGGVGVRKKKGVRKKTG